MPTRLSGRVGRGIHHGQKQALQQQTEYIAADHVSSSELFACNWAADHTLPNGCAVATHSLGDWMESGEGDHSLPGGRSPHLLRGAQRILGRRACVRRAGVS